jgi:hypothetical protein
VIENRQEGEIESSSSIEEKTKKIDGFPFDADGNLDIKRSTIENPNLVCELSVPVLKANKSKIKIPPSIKKSKAKYKTNLEPKSRFRIAVNGSTTKKQSIIFLFDRNK